jgi:hypothetical protein
LEEDVWIRVLVGKDSRKRRSEAIATLYVAPAEAGGQFSESGDFPDIGFRRNDGNDV